jgi:hypothetical protein
MEQNDLTEESAGPGKEQSDWKEESVKEEKEK